MRFTPEQAADPSTPADLLARIAQSQPELRNLVRRNPNAYPGLIAWIEEQESPRPSGDAKPLKPDNEAASEALPNRKSHAERRHALLPWAFSAFCLLATLVMAFVAFGPRSVVKTGGGIAETPKGQSSGAAPVFDTAEGAVRNAIEMIRRGDFDGLVRSSAVDQQVAGLDFSRQLERTGAWMPAQLAPNVGVYRELNRASLVGGLAYQYRSVVYSLLLKDDRFEETQFDSTIEGFPDAVATWLDPTSLSHLTAKRVKEIPLSDKAAASFNLDAAIYGADELREWAVLYQFDGRLFAGGMRVLRYGTTWTVSGLNSVFMGQSQGQALPEVSEEEFENSSRGA